MSTPNTFLFIDSLILLCGYKNQSVFIFIVQPYLSPFFSSPE
jgi:hypothetical protein